MVLPISNIITQAEKEHRFLPFEPATTGTEVRYDTTGPPGETELDKTKHNQNIIVAKQRSSMRGIWSGLQLGYESHIAKSIGGNLL